jgi:predicted transposase/invertase (TIGR01784 family)
MNDKKKAEELKMPYMIPWERTAERRGRRKGREEGREEEKKATAKNLLGMGIDIDKIVKATGLQKEVVEALRVKSN